MNLPNRITFARIILSIIIVGILIFPFDATGVVTYKLFVNESIVIDIKYIIAGVLFIIASLTDMIDGKVARKYKMVTDLDEVKNETFYSDVVPIIIYDVALRANSDYEGGGTH